MSVASCLYLRSLELFISKKSRSQRSNAIVAHWPNVIGSAIDTTGEAPMYVMYFLQHELTVKCTTDGQAKTCKVHLLAKVMWKDNHPYRERHIPTVIMFATTNIPEGCLLIFPCRESKVAVQ